MLISKSEFQSLCGLHDEGTFSAQCGRWHIMEKKLVDIQNGGQDLFDEISEDKASCRSKGERNVQSKIRHSEEELNRKGGSSVQVADSVELEEHVERLVRCAHFRLEDRQQVSPTTRWKYAKFRSC